VTIPWPGTGGKGTRSRTVKHIGCAVRDLCYRVAELAGKPSYRINLSGDRWATWRNGAERIASQQVEIKQEGELLQVATITRA
jgi:hypothetical protein